MALTTHPDTTGIGTRGDTPIVVELSERPLPVGMRVGSLRSSLRLTPPRLGIGPRILAVPAVAMALRFLSRDPGRIDLTLP